MTETTFNAKDLLEDILSAGKELAAQSKVKVAEGKAKVRASDVTQKSRELAKKGEDILAEKLGIEDTPAGREALRKGVGAGAAAGALALLLGSRSGRKLAVVGGLAGLGTLAYKAYQKNGGEMPESLDDAIALLTGPKSVYRSQSLVAAMVAAAKADGKINAEEMAFIKAHEGADAAALEVALSSDPDPVAIAKLADSPQAGREIYAVSCRVADGLNPKERDYLDALAMALKLDPELAARIETDIRTGA